MMTMPYKIIHDHPDCPKESGETGMDQVGGHAVVKEDDNTLMGCHKTHQSAEDQITALNIAESEADEYNYMKKKKKKKRSEQRDVNLTPPQFMQDNAQRGLDNLNRAGDGLTDKTKREARSMANGDPLSVDKTVRVSAWISRHLSDLDRDKTNPNDPTTWMASDVAFLLWGSNPWTEPTRAKDWADRKIAQLVDEGELEPRNVKSMSDINYPPQNVVKSNNMDNKTELRTWSISDVEQKDDEDGLITFAGYASVFDYQYPVNDLRGMYLESVAPGAFRKTLSEKDDVKLLVNHEGIPLARTKSNTLDLTEDSKGLRVEAKLDPANPKVAEVASAMKRNDLNEMSFAFQAIKDDYNEQGDERVIREAKLFDVSIVTTPASDATSAKIRGVDIPGLQKALAEARSDGQVNTEVLLSTIEQLQNLLPQKQQQTVALAKRKLQMLDIKK